MSQKPAEPKLPKESEGGLIHKQQDPKNPNPKKPVVINQPPKEQNKDDTLKKSIP
jgi:hypothetical protein